MCAIISAGVVAPEIIGKVGVTMDAGNKLSADAEINILAAAYTVYCELVESPLTPDIFRQKFKENGSQFADLVLGTSDK